MSKTLFGWLSERGMTTYDLAAMIGVSQSSAWRIASGLQLPRPRKRKAILELTGIDVYNEMTMNSLRPLYLELSDVAAQ